MVRASSKCLKKFMKAMGVRKDLKKLRATTTFLFKVKTKLRRKWIADFSPLQGMPYEMPRLSPPTEHSPAPSFDEDYLMSLIV